MYQTKTGSYDEIPEGMKIYINNYGCHFNKKLCEWAVSKMCKEVNGKEESIKSLSKEKVDSLLRNFGIKVERDKLYDSVYVANMCVADFLGKSIPDEYHMALYVKDVIDDVDAEEGYVFNAFYAKCMFNNEPIDWEEFI